MLDSTGPYLSVTLSCTSQVQQLLEFFDFVNINIASFGMPLQCLGLGNFEDHLAFTMFAPVVLAVAILLGFLAFPYLGAIWSLDPRWFRRGKPKKMLFAALPWLLLLTFLVAPMVSSSAFRAFSCESFDNGYTQRLCPQAPNSALCTLQCTMPTFLLLQAELPPSGLCDRVLQRVGEQLLACGAARLARHLAVSRGPASRSKKWYPLQ